MSMTLEQVIAVVQELPPELQSEVADFALFLRSRQSSKTSIPGEEGDANSGKDQKRPNFKWFGALSELHDEYTSVELQHQISEWRVESVPGRSV